MQITVLGAAGRTGQSLVAQALKEGHTVNALIRNPNGLKPTPGLTLFRGDATDIRDVASASTGSDLVISTLGTRMGKTTLMTDAVSAVIEASEMTHVTRFIVVSSYAVTGANNLSLGTELIARTFLKNIIADKISSEQLLRASDLDWTIVSPTILTNDEPRSAPRLVPSTEKITTRHRIARADVAAWILEEASNPRYVKKEIVISS
jgi:putative NADH-flavin reductase